MDAVAYKVMSAAEFARMRLDGHFAGSADDLRDGFIHMSGADQLDATVARYFSDRPDAVVLAIDLTRLADGLRWEESRGGALFPHLYGVLPADAVLASAPLERSAAGEVKRPA